MGWISRPTHRRVLVTLFGASLLATAVVAAVVFVVSLHRAGLAKNDKLRLAHVTAIPGLVVS
jgi:hypothetical protein